MASVPGEKRPSLKYRVRSAVYGRIANARDRLHNASPSWAKRTLWPLVDYLDMFFIDHGIFRLFYANRFKITDDVWRSAQPWPHQIRYYATAKGIKTIVNLRGERDCGSFRLEKGACEKHGIRLVNFKMRSGMPPDSALLHGFKDYFNALERPILIHCKSGADRAGIAAALYLLLNEDRPVEDALDQLNIRFGHFKHAKTGVLDHFLETYQADNTKEPIAFLDWVDAKYDPQAVKKDFKTDFWSRVLVEKILRRE